MKKLFIIVSAFLMGCASTQIPNYLPDKKPYTKRFYTNFSKVLEATQKALHEMGWQIEDTTDPAEFEQNRNYIADSQQTLMMTKIRQTPLFIGTRYAKMNIYLRSIDNLTEVEIRFLTVTSLPFKNIKNYHNDGAAQRVFNCIDELLKE